MKLVLYATLREIVGQSEVVVPIPTRRDLLTCLNDLAAQYGEEWRDTVLGEDGGMSEYVRIYVNGKEVHTIKDVFVADEDSVEILVPVAGG
jgi:molybdopterin converting factor small subunit